MKIKETRLKVRESVRRKYEKGNGGRKVQGKEEEEGEKRRMGKGGKRGK